MSDEIYSPSFRDYTFPAFNNAANSPQGATLTSGSGNSYTVYAGNNSAGTANPSYSFSPVTNVSQSAGQEIAPTVAPITTPNLPMQAPATPTQQALAQAKASGPAPQDVATANTAVNSLLPTTPTFYKPSTALPGYSSSTVFDAQGKALTYADYISAGGKKDFSNVVSSNPPQSAVNPILKSAVVDQQISNDPVTQRYINEITQLNSLANQSQSLSQYYQQISNQLGIQQINTDLVNMKNVIDGTEDDVRAEVTKAGGFATESQVAALTNARNKQLIKNYNNLLDTKQMAMETLTQMTNLAAQDRQFALQSLNTRIGIDEQLMNYQMKMQDNAVQKLNNIVENVGYAGLSQMTGGDPYYTNLVEKTLGLGSGGLAQLATYKKPLTEMEQADLALKQAQISQVKASTARTYADMRQTQDPVLSIDDAKALGVPYGTTRSEAIKKGIVPGNSKISPEQQVMQLSRQKDQVDQISGLLTDKGLNSSVGPNYMARFSVINSLTGIKSNFIAGIEQLRSNLNLEALINAKSKGATFGALSDQELQVLSNSATKLGSWAIKDNGNITGYNIDEDSFRKELDKINNFAKLDYVLKGGSPSDVNVIKLPDGNWATQNSDGTYNVFNELNGY